MAISKKKVTKKPAEKPEPEVITKTREPKVVWVDPPPVEKELPVKRLSLLSDGSAEVLLDNGKMLTLPEEMVKAIGRLK